MTGSGRIVSNAELRELLGAYAIDALDDDERALVEAHLAEDEELRDELGIYLDAAAALGSTAEAVPSPATWDRIMTAVRTGPRTRVSTPSPASGSATVAPVIVLDAAREARRFRRTAVGRTIAAAAVAAAVAVPVTLSLSGGSTPSIAAIASKAAKEPGSRTVELRRANGTSVGTVVVAAGGKGYLTRSSLPPLPKGKTYQLWAVTGATPVSAGLLGRAPGVSAFTLDAPATAIAVSIEPTAGSAQPSTTPLASGELT